MKCPRCKVEMVKGIALDHNCDSCCTCFSRTTTVNADNLDKALIDCLKCPECGHSDTGK